MQAGSHVCSFTFLLNTVCIYASVVASIVSAYVYARLQHLGQADTGMCRVDFINGM